MEGLAAVVCAGGGISHNYVYIVYCTGLLALHFLLEVIQKNTTRLSNHRDCSTGISAPLSPPLGERRVRSVLLVSVRVLFAHR